MAGPELDLLDLEGVAVVATAEQAAGRRLDGGRDRGELEGEQRLA